MGSERPVMLSKRFGESELGSEAIGLALTNLFLRDKQFYSSNTVTK